MGGAKKTAAQEEGRDRGGRMAGVQKKSTAEDELRPLTSEERDSWNGFCEIENEPALFNAILQDIGVKGVKVQEVVSLDEEMLAFLPKPIYGLIFLFRWREDDPHKQEQTCPESLWFANQTVENACATVALLNIIYNIEDIEIGEELKSFREFTKDLSPAMRGYAIGNFEFVKKVHNSFARKMDILNTDMLLKNQQKWKARGNQELDESEAGFHFIAFVKAKERVWKFDGLERQPQSLEYEEGEIEFSILSLSKDPMTGYLADLASNVKGLQHLNSRLSEFGDNCDEADPENAVLCGPDAQYGLTPAILELALVPSELAETAENGNRAHDLDSLARQRQALVEQQRLLRTQITDEQNSRQIELDYARRRRFDYSAAVNRWSRILARKRKCEELLS
ncbi:Peptidase C12, ubiquitin carboxyl-terminal hydrolase [Trichophyton rubrum]|nr:Peptidase C12, ubiquitin carboxyl-terminal hydrolase [Trichophyton rubrum]